MTNRSIALHGEGSIHETERSRRKKRRPEGGAMNSASTETMERRISMNFATKLG